MAHRYILLIDGEHYPPVIDRAVSALRAEGVEPELALLVGGGEKLSGDVQIGIPVKDVRGDPEGGLRAALGEIEVDGVFDLSDEPVLGYVPRMRMASIALFAGVTYLGPGFRFDPPDRACLATSPSVGVIGTGKRTGKTAVGGTAARIYEGAGLNPVVVAMGRGGPEHPEVIDDPEILEPDHLLSLVDSGKHAASDYIEDALMARVPAVGAWRAGGGLSGEPAFTNFRSAVEEANAMDPGLVLLEGSGAAVPPVRFDAGILVAGCGIDPGHLCGYMGLYRILLADLVVLTICEEPLDRARLKAVEQCIHDSSPKPPRVIHTIFRPEPLGRLEGKKVWFATTAPTDASETLKEHMEGKHGAQMIHISHSLADRAQLSEEIEEMDGAEVVAVELKAAAVDLVTREALDRGLQVVYVDNRVMAAGDTQDIEGPILEVAEMAKERFESR